MRATADLQAKVSVACDLLAVMHRDGGHHTAKVGFAQSCDDAREVRHALVDEVERLRAALDALVIVNGREIGFRSLHGIPMKMAAKIEKKVRAALRGEGEK
jgi:hypothetical protein